MYDFTKEGAEEVKQQYISRKLSVIIILGTVILLLLFGSLIGYGFFWNKYDQTSSSEKKVSVLKEQMFINPKDSIKQLELGWTYYQQGKYQEAKEQFEAFLNREKDHFDATFGLANSYIGLKNYQEAEKLLLHLNKTQAENADILHSLGIVYREQGKLEEAKQNLLMGLEINSLSSDIYYDLGLVYEKMENKEEAIAHYKKSIDFVPDYAEAIEGLKRLGIESYHPTQYHQQ